MPNQFSTGLTLAEQERLYLLLEEMGEAQQIVAKILRHGYESWNPNDFERVTNRTLLVRELGDVICAIDILTANGDLSREHIIDRVEEKTTTINPYLHYQPRPVRFVRPTARPVACNE